MSRSSRVLIQGTGVPGGRLEVVVPVDHTFATDFARATYDFPNAQYMWVRSWGEGEDEQGNKLNRVSNSTPMTFGEKTVGFIFLFILVLIGGLFADDDDTTPPAPEQPESTLEAPAAAPVAPAPVYVPSPASRPVYAAEPRVTPVWELDEDLTGNPDYTFND